MSSQAVLLIGASGNLGPYISFELLTQRSKFSRIAILADSAKVSKFAKEAEAGMEIVVGSFLDPASFAGFTTVICMLGNHAIALQPQVIDAAIAAGVTHFYPSEFGSDISTPVANKTRYFRDKLPTRRHLEEMAEKHKAAGFGYTYIVSGNFAEYAAHPAFGFDVVEKRFDFWGDTKKLAPMTGCRDVAKYTVASLLTIPEPGTVVSSPGRAFKFPTATYEWDQIVEILSRVEGVPWDIVRHPNAEAYELAAKYAALGNVDQELGYSLKAFIGDPEGELVPKPWDHGLFPDIEPESLEYSLRTLLAADKQ